MATYQEIRSLFNNDDLVNRVTVAVIIAANNLLEVTPSAADKKYAASVFASPRREAETVLMSVLAANAGATLSAITSATDAAIQAKVDIVVPLMVDALAGV